MKPNIKSIFCLMLTFMLLLTGIPAQTAQAASKSKPVAFKARSISMYAGETRKAELKRPKKSLQKKVKFTSSNKKLATVTKKGGMVKAKKKGNVKITAAYKGKKATLTVNIKKKAKNPKIVLNKKKATLTVGGRTKLKVKSKKGVSLKSVTYKSSNKKVATVNKKTGKVVAKRPGKATITATSTVNRKVKAKCKVTVKAKSPSTNQSPDKPDGPEDPEPEQHEYDKEFTVDREPACETDGEKSRHCLIHKDKADDRTDVTAIPAKGHAWDEGTRHDACEGEGSVIYSCTSCGHLRSEAIPATGHSYDEGAVRLEPSCTAEGMTVYTCSSCGGTKEEPIPAKGHNFGEWEVKDAPQCEDEGTNTRSCLECGYAELEPVPAEGHEWEEGLTVDKEPTCTQDGSQSRHCKKCSMVKDSEPIEKTGHDYKLTNTADADCEHNGILTYTCKACGHSYDDGTSLPKLGHAYADGACTRCGAKDPQALPEDVKTVGGLVDGGEYKVGSTITVPDGYVLKINGSIADLEDGEYAFKEAGSYSVELVGPDGTSTTITVTMSDNASPSFSQILDGGTYPAGQEISVPQGWTLTVNGQPCEDGSYSFKEDGEYEITVTDADGNTYTKHITIQHMHEYSSEVTKEPGCTEDGTLTFTCQACGRSYTQAILHTGHDYPEWETVDEATCTEKGLKRRTCKSCGNVDEEELNALGHNKADAFTVDSEATCTEAGTKSKHCTRCDEKLDVTKLPALGHNAADEFTTDKAATCTEAGTKSKHCTRCDEKLDITELPALGHSFGEWKVVKAATCMATGTSERACTRCAHKEGRTDAKLTTHAYASAYTTDTAATCTAAGSKSRHCTVSGCTAKTDVTSIAAIGHSYGSWVTTSNATCTAAGSKKHTCSRCSHVETQTIAALGHNYSSTYTIDKAATCTTAGSKSRHCTRCTAKTDNTAISATGHDSVGLSDGKIICYRCNTAVEVEEQYMICTIANIQQVAYTGKLQSVKLNISSTSNTSGHIRLKKLAEFMPIENTSMNLTASKYPAGTIPVTVNVTVDGADVILDISAGANVFSLYDVTLTRKL